MFQLAEEEATRLRSQIVTSLCGPKLKRQPRSNRTVRGESPRRGGGPPLSVGSVGRAERLLPGLQARGPSPRTKGSGEM